MKRLLLCLWALMIASVLTACGDKSGSSDKDADKDKDKSTQKDASTRPGESDKDKSANRDKTVNQNLNPPPGGTARNSSDENVEPIEKIGTVEGLGEGVSKTVPKSKFIGSLGKALIRGTSDAFSGDKNDEPVPPPDGKDGK